MDECLTLTAIPRDPSIRTLGTPPTLHNGYRADQFDSFELVIVPQQLLGSACWRGPYSVLVFSNRMGFAPGTYADERPFPNSSEYLSGAARIAVSPIEVTQADAKKIRFSNGSTSISGKLVMLPAPLL